MAYEHQILSDDELGPLAARMVGEAAPPKMKTLVAKGLAPLPPRDMLVALYQVWVGGGDLGEVAAKTVTTLPDPTISGAIADVRLPAGVLDLLGRKLIRKGELLDAVVRHPNADDQTIIGVARVCPEMVCETIARAETRWLNCPEIVASLYQNRHCAMSLIHRILEMAEREGVEVRMAGMEEVKAAMHADAETGEVFDESTDANFSAALAGDEPDNFAEGLLGAGIEDDLSLPTLDTLDFDTDPLEDLSLPTAEPEPEEEKTFQSRSAEIMQMRPSEKVRAALLGSKSDRNILVRDSNRVVAMAAVKSPKVTDAEACGWSSNRALNPDVVRYIANKRDWIKLYTVKLNLVNNPKTPMAKAMSLMAYLNRNDLAKLARSKSVPSALAKAAKRKIGGGR
jgi:hypothetical protein